MSYYDPYGVENLPPNSYDKSGFYYRDAPLLRPNRAKKIIAHIGSPMRNRRHTYLSNKSCCHPNPFSLTHGNFPYIILTFTLSQIGFFIYLLVLTLKRTETTRDISFSDAYLEICQNQTLIRFNSSKFWTYFSYILIPASLSQIISTTLIQIILGIPLELVHGSIRVFLLYFIGAISGSMLNYILTPGASEILTNQQNLISRVLQINAENHVFLGGAHGACYSLIGAWIANVLLNADVMSICGFLSRILPITLYIVLDLFITIMSKLIYNERNAPDFNRLPKDHIFRTAKEMLDAFGIYDYFYWTTPLIGFIFGVSCGFLLLKPFNEMLTWETCCCKFLFVFWMLLIIALVACQIIPIKIDCIGSIQFFQFNVTSTCFNN